MPDGVYRMREEGPPGYRGQPTIVDAAFPDYEPASPNLRLVEDLVRSLDTGEPPRGGVRAAHAGTELIFATIESHLRGGARVELPLKAPVRFGFSEIAHLDNRGIILGPDTPLRQKEKQNSAKDNIN